MRAVLLPTHPEWCMEIISGRKTIEVRKSKPKEAEPFKVLLYCTKGGKLLTKSHYNGDIYLTFPKYRKLLEKRGSTTLNGKVIGEFVCDRIDTYDDDTIHAFSYEEYSKWNDFELNRACIHPEDFEEYANDSWLYGWHISALKIYDEPKELSDFGLSRAPQSWCYVEDKCLFFA